MKELPTISIKHGFSIDGPMEVIEEAMNILLSVSKNVSSDVDIDYYFSQVISSIMNPDDYSYSVAKETIDAEVGLDVNPGILGISYAMLASVEFNRGDMHEAWCNASYASLMIGIYSGGLMSGKYAASSAISELSKRATDKRHAQNRSLKATAREMYLSGRYQNNKDEAASAIATEINMAFSTVRDWLKGI